MSGIVLPEPLDGHMAHKVRVFNSHLHLPKSKPLRIGLGTMLVGFGFLGFLPVLGFWMIPLGFLVLSVDLPAVRRWRRQVTVWWYRKNGEGKNNGAKKSEGKGPGVDGGSAPQAQ